MFARGVEFRKGVALVPSRGRGRRIEDVVIFRIPGGVHTKVGGGVRRMALCKAPLVVPDWLSLVALIPKRLRAGVPFREATA